MQLLPLDRYLANGFVLLHITIPQIDGQVAEAARNLELVLLAEERRQCAFDGGCAADLLLVQRNCAVDIASALCAAASVGRIATAQILCLAWN